MLHLVKRLTAAGLSERESRIYLTALMLGECTVGELSEYTKINRSTIYHIAESLNNLNLMQIKETDKKKTFKAAPPENVIDLMKKESDEILKRIRTVEDSLPELEALENEDATRPKVYYYDGVEGILEIARRYEEKTDDFFEIVQYDNLRKFFETNDFDNHKKKLTKRRIKGKILVVSDKPPTESMNKLKKQNGWEVRYIGKDKAGDMGHISVKSDEIYAFSYESLPTGLVIQNKPIAEALKRVFQLAWDQASTKPENNKTEQIEFKIN